MRPIIDIGVKRVDVGDSIPEVVPGLVIRKIEVVVIELGVEFVIPRYGYNRKLGNERFGGCKEMGLPLLPYETLVDDISCMQDEIDIVFFCVLKHSFGEAAVNVREVAAVAVKQKAEFCVVWRSGFEGSLV